MPMEAYIQNLYCRTAMNFGFAGDEVGLPFEVSLRLVDFFLFFKDIDGYQLRDLLVFCLQKQEKMILGLQNDDIFRYISNGMFITDVFMNENSYMEFLEDFI